MDIKDLKFGFDTLLGAETIVRRQKRNAKNKTKDLFISIIRKYDIALVKSIKLQAEFQIDMSSYEDPFYNIIDEILLLGWGEDVYRIIAFYLYERINPDGTENFLIGPNLEELFIRTPEDLYQTIITIFPETFN